MVKKQLAISFCVLALLMLACGQYTSPLPTVSVTTTPELDAATIPSPTKTVAVSTPTPAKQTASVVKTFVRIHAEPDGVVNGYVEYGDVLEIVQCEDKWCQIKEPSGWIWAGCLDRSVNKENLGCEAG